MPTGSSYSILLIMRLGTGSSYSIRTENAITEVQNRSVCPLVLGDEASAGADAAKQNAITEVQHRSVCPLVLGEVPGLADAAKQLPSR